MDPTNKEGEVTNLLATASKKRIEEEIKKCVVLCRNCHADVHHELSADTIIRSDGAMVA